jgi:hypothetical protein
MVDSYPKSLLKTGYVTTGFLRGGSIEDRLEGASKVMKDGSTKKGFIDPSRSF